MTLRGRSKSGFVRFVFGDMLHIITGGSGSGKSAYAEDEILNLGNEKRYYIATMRPFDQESYRRIDRHRAMRADKGFVTIEKYTHLEEIEISENADVLLECMSNLVANEMYEEHGAGEKTVDAVLEAVRVLKKKTKNLIVVTNEISSDCQRYSDETLKYMKYLGEINCALAKDADIVTEVVYGIPVHIKKAEL